MTTQNRFPTIQTVQVATKISAPNDVNGNPRRLWIVNEVVHNGINAPHSNRVGIVEEGTLRETFPNVVIGEQIGVTAKEYNRYIKEKKELDRVKALTDEQLLKELNN